MRYLNRKKKHMAPKNSAGRIVNYMLTDEDVNAIEVLRQTKIGTDGELLYKGNATTPGDVVPVIVTKVHADSSINGRVILDGNDFHWITSVRAADYDEDSKTFKQELGTWFLPQRY